MDPPRFDRWPTSLPAPGSRCRLVQALAEILLGAILSALGGEASPAKRLREGRQKRQRPGRHNDNRKGTAKGKDMGWSDQPGWQCLGRDLSGDLRGCNLCSAELSGTALVRTVQDDAELENVHRVGANM